MPRGPDMNSYHVLDKELTTFDVWFDTLAGLKDDKRDEDPQILSSVREKSRMRIDAWLCVLSFRRKQGKYVE